MLRVVDVHGRLVENLARPRHFRHLDKHQLARQAGIDFVKTSTGFHPAGGASVEAVRRKVGDGYFAVGASLLTGCPDRRPHTRAVIDWIKSHQPVARVGTFAVYRFD